MTAFAAGSLPVGVLAGGLLHRTGPRPGGGGGGGGGGAFDNGYTLALAITAIALAAGSAFTYRYLKRQPTTPTEQAQHPEPAQHGRAAA